MQQQERPARHAQTPRKHRKQTSPKKNKDLEKELTKLSTLIDKNSCETQVREDMYNSMRMSTKGTDACPNGFSSPPKVVAALAEASGDCDGSGLLVRRYVMFAATVTRRREALQACTTEIEWLRWQNAVDAKDKMHLVRMHQTRTHVNTLGKVCRKQTMPCRTSRKESEPCHLRVSCHVIAGFSAVGFSGLEPCNFRAFCCLIPGFWSRISRKSCPALPGIPRQEYLNSHRTGIRIPKCTQIPAELRPGQSAPEELTAVLVSQALGNSIWRLSTLPNNPSTP